MIKARQRAFDALAAFEHVTDGAALLAQSARILAEFGFTAFVVTRLPRNGPAEQPEILLNGWPAGWSDRYEEARHFSRDPVASYCASSISPFAWTEIPHDHMNGPDGGRVVDEASEFGLTHGLCIPVHTGLGLGGMSLAGENYDDAPDMRLLASLLTFRIWNALELIGPGAPGGDRLSIRERDVLSWIAMGKTSEEVGIILSISAHTVGEHLKNIRSKLQASNTAHAIVKALKGGQLHL